MPNDLTRFASRAERRAATSLINQLVDVNYLVRVHDGEEWACDLTSDPTLALNAMASTGQDVVHAYVRAGTELHCLMSFALIYQQATEQDEVIYDYGARDYDLQALADRIAGKAGLA